MYKEKKISVAIAAYNGEKYIQKQIESICDQTTVPDEIVVSDDGSKDSTINIVKSLAEKYKGSIDIKLLMNNPRHGYCGNFEWAITHTMGDYVFISDQDDLWYPNKIETIMRVFELHPEAECVFHEAELIDENGDALQGVFNHFTHSYLESKDVETSYKLDRDKYLSAAVSQPLTKGMVLCITKEFLKTCIPFPKCDGFHDQWMVFCAVINDKCRYTPAVLEGYRLHGNNVCGNDAYHGKKVTHVKNMLSRLKIKGIRNSLDLYYQGSCMKSMILEKGFVDSDAYRIANRVLEIGEKELSAVSSGRMNGAWQLYQMYKNDIRYRSIGRSSFICQLCRILLYSKSKRNLVLYNDNQK